MNGLLRRLLKAVGKGDAKVAAVFAIGAEAGHAAVEHLRRGAPEVPVWLFAVCEPLPETRPLCARVTVRRGSLALLANAQSALWPHWVAIAAATWTGERGRWLVKLAPLFVPPFRAVLLNRHGDFVPGTPSKIAHHAWRQLRDTLHSGAHRIGDLASFGWEVVSYHIWRSGPVTRLRDETAGLFLWLASVALRLISPLRRILVARVASTTRGGALVVDLPPAADGTGILRVCQRGTHWSWRSLSAAAETTDARWILWKQADNSPEPPAEAQALFADQRTFAVASQVDFRAWKRLLFPTAPFRTLQAGECSEVLAPLGPSVLVDRRKLVALGIPHASLAGTAWMVLFWKASAAGWRSYSIGCGSTLREQPDYPMQETGFLLRWLFGGLGALAPREPALSRGNIAQPLCQPARNPRREAPLRILLVSPFLPYPLSHGGAVRIWNLCRAMRDRAEFLLVAIREKEDVVDYAKLAEVFREVYVVDKDQRPGTDVSLPVQVRQHESGSLRALIAELARIRKPDLLQVEYTHMAGFRNAATEIPALLVEHDLTFSLYRQLAEAKGAGPTEAAEYRRWLAFERRWLEQYEGVWTVSAEDRDIACTESGRPPSRTFAVPNGVDVERFVPHDEHTAAPEIFYVGSFRHLPNILGFEKLRGEIMPRVWSRYPEARLRVVAGPRHLEFWKRFARASGPPEFDSRVEIHGFVEDLRPLYAKAAVVVVPLDVSAGTNIKVLEAMACGKAIVSTPVGCAGLGLRDGIDAGIESDWDGFGRAVSELLSDDAARVALGAAARRTVEERFSWTAIARDACQSYYDLCGVQEPRTQKFATDRSLTGL